MINFTSDLHLGHANAIKRRPFESVEEMNETLINNINSVVGEDDELWVLGDFAFRINTDEVRELRRKIKCKHIHLVKGNHDKDYTGDKIFESVYTYKELKTEYGRFVLFHFPILEWNTGHYGSVHLHGHIHSDGLYNKENLGKKYCDRFAWGHDVKNSELGLRIYDVGVDANDYKPVSIEQIAEMMKLEKV